MKKRIYFLLIFSLIFLETGCSLNGNFFNGKKKSKQINNLLDINSDGKSDLVFWNLNNSEKNLGDNEKGYFETVSVQNTNYQNTKLGNPGDIPVYGDFNGDGATDYGLFQNVDGINRWYFIDGLSKTIFQERSGLVTDIPIPGDYDGDGKCDLVVYRPHNSGFYGTLSGKNKLLEIHLGITGDIPVSKDYDGDGVADLAVYRINSGSWLVRFSRSDLSKVLMLGGKGFFPLPADYDGDGKSDLAVWNPKNHECKVAFSSFNQKLSNETIKKIKEKLNGLKLFPASSDYDGDGKSELAFWEYKKNILHIFKLKSNDFKYNSFQVTVNETSTPINYFLLKKYLMRKNIAGFKTTDLFRIYKAQTKTNEFSCDVDGDFLNDRGKYDSSAMAIIVKESSSKEEKKFSLPSASGKFLAGDFDGDGMCDSGFADVDGKKFTYFTEGFKTLSSIDLDKKVNGIPFSADIDLDFMADPVFYNPDTKIFGFQSSSEGYRYGEVELSDKR